MARGGGNWFDIALGVSAAAHANQKMKQERERDLLIGMVETGFGDKKFEDLSAKEKVWLEQYVKVNIVKPRLWYSSVLWLALLFLIFSLLITVFSVTLSGAGNQLLSTGASGLIVVLLVICYLLAFICLFSGLFLRKRYNDQRLYQAAKSTAPAEMIDKFGK